MCPTYSNIIFSRWRRHWMKLLKILLSDIVFLLIHEDNVLYGENISALQTN